MGDWLVEVDGTSDIVHCVLLGCLVLGLLGVSVECGEIVLVSQLTEEIQRSKAHFKF